MLSELTLILAVYQSKSMLELKRMSPCFEKAEMICHHIQLFLLICSFVGTILQISGEQLWQEFKIMKVLLSSSLPSGTSLLRILK